MLYLIKYYIFINLKVFNDLKINPKNNGTE